MYVIFKKTCHINRKVYIEILSKGITCLHFFLCQETALQDILMILHALMDYLSKKVYPWFFTSHFNEHFVNSIFMTTMMKLFLSDIKVVWWNFIGPSRHQHYSKSHLYMRLHSMEKHEILSDMEKNKWCSILIDFYL